MSAKSSAPLARAAVVFVTGLILGLPAPGVSQEPARKSLDGLGDPLPDRALLRIGSTRLRHAGAVTALAFSPDGELLVSGGDDRRLRMWRMLDGKLVMEESGDVVAAINFLPDGLTFASLSRMGNVGLWNVAAGRQIKEIAGIGGIGTQTQVLRCSMDGKSASLADDRGQVAVRDLATGKKTQEFRLMLDAFFKVALSPDGKRIAWAGRDHAVSISEVATGKQLLKLPGEKNRPIRAAAFSADGRYVAAGGIFSQITVWELASGQALVTLPSRDPMFAFSPDGRTLATCGQSAGVHLWDLATGEERRTLHHPSRAPEILAFSADGRHLAAASRDGLIRVWDPVTGENRLAATNSLGGNPSAFLENEKKLVLDTPDGLVFFAVADPSRGAKAWGVKEQQRLSGFHGLVAPDGKTIVCVDAGRNIVLWDVARNAERRPLDQGDRLPGMPSLAYAPDGQTFALALPRGIELYDVATGKAVRKFGDMKGLTPGLAFTPDGKMLIGADNALRYWDVKTGKEIRQTLIPSNRERDFDYVDRHGYLTLRISPGGNVLAISSHARSVQLWDLAKASPVGKPRASGPFAFSPDGRWLATAEKSTVQLWELATGRAIAELPGHTGAITSLLFAPNGQVLATGSADYTTLLWDVRLQRLFASAVPAGKSEDAQRKRDWDALAELDVLAAYQAMVRLAADPAPTVALLEKCLHPVALSPAKQLQQWIADLNSTNFETRDKASVELKKLGPLAEVALKTAIEANPPLEAKRRLEGLVAALVNEEIDQPAGDTLRTIRVVHLLEDLGTPQARRLLDRLVGGAPEALQTRLARGSLRRLNRDSRLP